MGKVRERCHATKVPNLETNQKVTVKWYKPIDVTTFLAQEVDIAIPNPTYEAQIGLFLTPNSTTLCSSLTVSSFGHPSILLPITDYIRWDVFSGLFAALFRDNRQ